MTVATPGHFPDHNVFEDNIISMSFVSKKSYSNGVQAHIATYLCTGLIRVSQGKKSLNYETKGSIVNML